MMMQGTNHKDVEDALRQAIDALERARAIAAKRPALMLTRSQVSRLIGRAIELVSEAELLNDQADTNPIR